MPGRNAPKPVRIWAGIALLVVALSLLFSTLAAGQPPAVAIFLPRMEVGYDSRRTVTPTSQLQTPTPTPTRTRTATPTGTVVAPALRVENDRFYADPVGGGLHLVGEVHNTSATNQSSVRVRVDLLQDGQVVRTFNQNAIIFNLRPGDRTPFDVAMGTPPNFDDYVITASGQVAANPPVDNFTILSQRTYADADDNQWVVGELRNDLTSNAALVLVVGTFYQPDGLVWRPAQSYTMLAKLLPGQRSPFRLSAPGASLIANHALEVRGVANASAPRGDLAVVNSSAGQQGTQLVISGQVRNTGATQATNVQVVATLYNGANQVVNAGASTPATLAASATAAFQIIVDSHWQGYTRYELQVQGN